MTDLARHVLASLAGPARQATEKHLHLALVNLYAAWADDPTLSLALSMSNSGYKARSRYNPAAASNQIIQVVEGLAKAGYVHGKSGFQDRRMGSGRTTRIWPTALLIGLFEQARLRGPSISRVAGVEVIIQRNAKRKNVEYIDTPDTRAKRSRLAAYNGLLARTFIDIPELEQPVLNMTGGGRLRINQHDKLVRRVFNRSAWDKGGRFYGGWWQRCPKEWREKIFINDHPTIEDDYSGLHIVMLYARVGIDYWATVGTTEDPYRLDETPGFAGSAAECRAYAKGLLLMAINADTDKAAFQAFRADMRDRKDARGAGLKDAQLAVILDALKAKHAPIAEFIGAGAGIDLMNEDAKITDEIVRLFVLANRPILTIHDSYIVMFGDDQRLRDALKQAFAKVTGVSTVHLKRKGLGYGEVTAARSGPRSALEEDGVQRLTEAVNRERSVGYLQRLADFHSC